MDVTDSTDADVDDTDSNSGGDGDGAGGNADTSAGADVSTGTGAESIKVRQARPADDDAVRSFTENTWPDRGGDYIPRIYHDWIAGDGDDQRTFVVEAGGRVAGICQGVLLSEDEAWAQGMRVDPDLRGEGLSRTLNDALFDWAARRGAAVCRNMVFSWNSAGLGGSRAAGFSPRAEFRWAHPEPDADAEVEADAETDSTLVVHGNPDVAWSYWQRSDAREALRGLALDRTESWAVSALTRADLREAAAETRVFAVQGDDARGSAYRVRDYKRDVRSDEGEGDDDAESNDGNEIDRNEKATTTERWAEYGVGAWADVASARALFAAIRTDAAALDADRTRVLIPETPRRVSDAAVCRVETDPEPDFVFEADLTGRTGRTGRRDR